MHYVVILSNIEATGTSDGVMPTFDISERKSKEGVDQMSGPVFFSKGFNQKRPENGPFFDKDLIA